MASRLTLAFLVGMLTATTCVGQTITETFDSGIPGAWSIVDNHILNPSIPDFSAVPWTTNDVESLGNYTNGTPSLAATASSYNHPGQYDVSLITPPFALTAGANGRSVRYDVNFYRVDGFEFFDTNLSINGGDWITMTHDTSTLGAPYSFGPPRVTRTIDLTFFGAAVGDTARVEFRYYSTYLLPMVHNEYVQIDNVRIPEPLPVPEPTSLTGFVATFATVVGIGGARFNRSVRGRMRRE